VHETETTYVIYSN